MDADLKMLAYAPSVVAVAVVLDFLEEKSALEENLGKIMNLFGEEHKVKLKGCNNLFNCNIVSTNEIYL